MHRIDEFYHYLLVSFLHTDRLAYTYNILLNQIKIFFKFESLRNAKENPFLIKIENL